MAKFDFHLITIPQVVNPFRIRSGLIGRKGGISNCETGLTAQIKPNDKADVRISVRFSEVIKRRIEQPSLQPGQILGGVVSLRS